MRKLKIVAVLMSVLVIGAVVAGCSCSASSSSSSSVSSGTSTESSGKDLVGSWTYQSGGYTYTFNEDGTGQYDTGGNVMKFTYTVSGDKLSILYDGNTAPMDTTYTISGDTLTIKDSLGSDVVYKKK
ncbi:MAG: hypothetical protein K5644_08040 [Lachnospiraceae bacterium]|nr:hypothetical protein [Lachnospiraceae bacterium]